MKPARNDLVQMAMTAALRTRQNAGYALHHPLCVYDLAEKLEVEVRFADIPSMEGVYLNEENPTVIVSSLRPPGRQAFTCAHELGHHIFGHGTQYDELVGQRSSARRLDPQELQADCFAGALLMPKVAVSRGFSVRSWDPAVCPPESFYVVSHWLGVGYTTLIHHMCATLRMLSPHRAEALRRSNLTVLRSSLSGRPCRAPLVVVDRQWEGRAVDIEVGDLICLPRNVTLEGICAAMIEEQTDRVLVQGLRPGLGRAVDSKTPWSVFIRVRRKHYVGRGKYQFEEQCDDDE